MLVNSLLSILCYNYVEFRNHVIQLAYTGTNQTNDMSKLDMKCIPKQTHKLCMNNSLKG